MNPVIVRGLSIGSGMPKICVPIVGVTKEEIMDKTKLVLESSADLVEWRGDWYEDIFQIEKVAEVLKEMRNVLGNIPILFTFRTAKEGGEKEISMEAYKTLNEQIADTGLVDLVDVEMFSDEAAVKEMILYIHNAGVNKSKY